MKSIPCSMMFQSSVAGQVGVPELAGKATGQHGGRCALCVCCDHYGRALRAVVVARLCLSSVSDCQCAALFRPAREVRSWQKRGHLSAPDV